MVRWFVLVQLVEKSSFLNRSSLASSELCCRLRGALNHQAMSAQWKLPDRVRGKNWWNWEKGHGELLKEDLAHAGEGGVELLLLCVCLCVCFLSHKPWQAEVK